MQRESAQVELDLLLSTLASAQHGVVAWFQLREAGVARGRVDRLLERGRLHIVFRGVYAVGHEALTRQGRLMAAVLALGPDAVLSHQSAAALWGLLPDSPGPIHVTVPGRGARRRRAGILVHRSPSVQSEERDGIPVTTVPWTLLDLAGSAPARTLARAVEGAEAAELFDLRALEPLLTGSRPGVRELRAALAAYDDAPSDSELERRFLAFCRDHELPRPLTQQIVEGFRVDFFWPEHRLVVETDGLAYHATRAAVERDHHRDAVLALAGILTRRFTWHQITSTPDDIATLLKRTLRERAPERVVAL